MRLSVGLVNLLIGVVYTSYGVMTVTELARGWRTVGPSHFGLAWCAMAFTCGPHHLAHATHIAAARTPTALELITVVIGVPAGVTWFLLRIEAVRGGLGDRPIAGDPLWIRALPALGIAYTAVFVVGVTIPLMQRAEFSPRLTPNILLVGLYVMVGYYLLRTQLTSRAEGNPWSLSGISLTVVFPTCALMHAAFLAGAMHGDYGADAHGLVIDWLAVPAAAYFLWVVRRLWLGNLPDWNITLRPLAQQAS